MSSDVVLSAALRNNLLTLQNTQRSIDTTQLRLATGKKINSALDGAQSFFAAQSLTNRATDLARLLDGINQSVRTIEQANKGISALTNLVEQAQSVASEAQSEAQSASGFVSILGTRDLTEVSDLVDSSTGIDANDDLVIQVRRATGTSNITSGDINIADGANVFDVAAGINNDTNVSPYVRASVVNGRLKIESLEEDLVIRIRSGTGAIGAQGFATLGLDNVVGTEAVETGATTTRDAGTAIAGRVLRSAVSGGTAVNGLYQASDTLDTANFIATSDNVDFRIIVDGQSSGNITVADTDTIQELLDGINNNATIGDLVTASFNTTTGRIELAFADGVSQAEIQIEANTAADVTTFGFGTGASDLTASSLINADNSELFTFVGSSANLAQFQDDYNNLRDQIDALVEDAGYRGINLLNGGNLETFFNESRSNSLVTEGVDFTSVGLGIDEADFTTSGNVQEALDQAKAALTSIRAFGSSIANDLAIIQTRRDFTESTIQTLKAGADDLTLADQNEEGANLLALQTRQQLGITSLALASQSQQAVLRLF